MRSKKALSPSTAAMVERILHENMFLKKQVKMLQRPSKVVVNKENDRLEESFKLKMQKLKTKRNLFLDNRPTNINLKSQISAPQLLNSPRKTNTYYRNYQQDNPFRITQNSPRQSNHSNNLKDCLDQSVYSPFLTLTNSPMKNKLLYSSKQNTQNNTPVKSVQNHFSINNTQNQFPAKQKKNSSPRYMTRHHSTYIINQGLPKTDEMCFYRASQMAETQSKIIKRSPIKQINQIYMKSLKSSQVKAHKEQIQHKQHLKEQPKRKTRLRSDVYMIDNS